MTTVLIVDDSEVDRRLAGLCVEETGAQPTYAQNGREALEMVAKERPDAVVTDLKMPEIGGLELVQQLRSDHPGLPVILMTAWGSEDIAATALKAGAASYVPKKNLKLDLGNALRTALASVREARELERACKYLESIESRFVLGFDPEGAEALVEHLQNDLQRLDFCDENILTQVGTALMEALSNAIYHGNLELDSKIRETSMADYRALAAQRAAESPYKERRVHVTARLTRDVAFYSVRDEGPGFDVDSLPDPTNPENLLRASGRGVVLIRTFMDEVTYNDTGNEIAMLVRRAS